MPKVEEKILMLIRIIVILTILIFNFLPVKSSELDKCEWKNKSGKPCLTIFSAPNTSKITLETLGKTVITKNK